MVWINALIVSGGGEIIENADLGADVLSLSGSGRGQGRRHRRQPRPLVRGPRRHVDCR